MQLISQIFFHYIFHDQTILSLISGFPLMKKALHSQTMAKQIKKVLDWPNLTPFMKPCSPVLTVDWPGPLGPKFPSGGNQLPHRLVWPIDPKKKWHSLCWTHFGLWLRLSFNKELTFFLGKEMFMGIFGPKSGDFQPKNAKRGIFSQVGIKGRSGWYSDIPTLLNSFWFMIAS